MKPRGLIFPANRAFPALLSGVLLAGLVAGIGCSSRKPTRSRAFPAMGTIVEIHLSNAEAHDLDTALVLAQREVEAVENALSVFRETSDLSRINREAHRAPQPLEDPVLTVCLYALKISEWSDGAFDPTVKPLLDDWGFGSAPVTHEPDEAALAAAKERVGWRNIVLKSVPGGDRRIAFNRPGLALDFGGIAKGYAVDRIDAAFQEAGMTHYMINAGGNILCRGGPSGDGRPWQIGIRNPFAGRHEILGRLEMSDGQAVATSGNYERFRIYGGKRFAHIFDPRSGRPVEGMAAVTVLASSAMEADALSTALFVLGVEEGLARLKSFEPEPAVLFVPDTRPIEVVVNPPMERRWRPRKGLRARSPEAPAKERP